MTTDRRLITFRCFGCGAFVIERVAREGRRPKVKPLGWILRRAWSQEPASGILREVQLNFCASACAEDPDINTPMARRARDYVGAGGRPANVTFMCVGCGKTATSTTRILPVPWQMVPLPAPDYDTGATRITSLPVCSVPCLNRIGGATEVPEVVRVERDRLFAGRGA